MKTWINEYVIVKTEILSLAQSLCVSILLSWMLIPRLQRKELLT